MQQWFCKHPFLYLTASLSNSSNWQLATEAKRLRLRGVRIIKSCEGICYSLKNSRLLKDGNNRVVVAANHRAGFPPLWPGDVILKITWYILRVTFLYYSWPIHGLMIILSILKARNFYDDQTIWSPRCYVYYHDFAWPSIFKANRSEAHLLFVFHYLT